MSRLVYILVLLVLCQYSCDIEAPEPQNNLHILVVPDEYPTIQTAIDSAKTSDTIHVQPGRYYENLYLNKKGLTFISNYFFSGDSGDIHNTIIDGFKLNSFPYSGAVLTLKECQDTSKIIGFTLRHNTQSGDYCGGGIKCISSILKVSHCNIDSCYLSMPNSRGEGGGIYATDSYISLSNVSIKYCTVLKGGSGIEAYSCKLYIENSTISNNRASRLYFFSNIPNGLWVTDSEINFKKVIVKDNLPGSASVNLLTYCTGTITQSYFMEKLVLEGSTVTISE